MKTLNCGKKSKGELTKDKILAEATRLVHKKGFEATTINDMVKATGLKKGCLYFHFSGKDELSLAVLEKAKADFFAFLDSLLEGKTPRNRLNNLFRGIQDAQRDMGFSGGCIFGNTALEMGDKDENLAAFVRGVFDEVTEKVRKVVKAAQVTGQVRKDIPAGTLARHIVMAVEGGIMLTRLEKSEKPLKDCVDSLRTLIGLKK